MHVGWNALELIDVRMDGVDASSHLAPRTSHLARRTSRRAPRAPHLARRDDEGLIDELAAAGVACVLYFPLRRLSNQQSETPERVATELADDVTQIAIPAQ